MGIVWIIRNYLFKPKKTAEMIYPSDINIVGSRKFLMFIFFFAGAFIILKQTGFSVYSLVSALILLFIVMTGTNLFIKGVAGVYRIIYKKAAKKRDRKGRDRNSSVTCDADICVYCSFICCSSSVLS
jgi:hypothetical protein